MNIAVLINLNPPGAEFGAAALTKCLEEKGHKVWVTHRPCDYASLPTPRRKPWDLVLAQVNTIEDVAAAREAGEKMSAVHRFSIGMFTPDGFTTKNAIEDVLLSIQ